MPLEYSTGETISLLPRMLNYLNQLLFVTGIAAATVSIIFVIALAFLGAGSQRIPFPLAFDANNQFRSTFASWALVNNIKFENTDYHLTYYTPDSTEGQFDYYLYACDTRDWLCQEIYNDSAFSISERLGNFDIHAATLLPDPTACTITLQINGEAVYVHPVK